MLTPRQENERTLARLVGISEDEAAQRLAFKVRVRASGAQTHGFAMHVRGLLAFTLQVVGDNEPANLELAVNCQPTGDTAQTLYVSIDDQSMRIAEGLSEPLAANVPPPHDLCAKLAACYAAGVVIAHATGGSRRERLVLPFVVRFDSLGLTTSLLNRTVTLQDTVLAGAGGVASGFVWALESLDVRGELDVADPKAVSTGNLNRCFHYGLTDVGNAKAMTLSVKAKLPGLTLTPFVGPFGDLRRQRGRIKRVIVTVDSRAARRDIQKEFPLEVIDASTTDVSEVVVHSHAQPNSGACLCCIYHHIPREDERLRSIAEGLGVTFEDIRGKDLIDADLSIRLADVHGLDAAAIEGLALTSLYKELCATQALKTSAGEQAFAPFAFVSNLAGVLLAIELLRFDADPSAERSASYMSLDPWSPPHGRARRLRAKREGCEFCSNKDSAELMAIIWPDRFIDQSSAADPDERAA